MATASKTAGAAGSVTIVIKNSAGQSVTPVSTPTVTWYTDSGRTTGALALSVSGSGTTYTASWTAGQAPATPANRYLKVTIEVSTGVFDTDVDDDISFVDAGSILSPTELCSVAEVRLQLNTSQTVDDSEIQDYIDAITGPVTDYCGIVLPTTVTERHKVSGPCIVLDERVVSITSVTMYDGSSAHTMTAAANPSQGTAYSYLRDGRTLERIDSSGDCLGWDGWVYITYTAGFAEVPADLNLAARLLVQSYWRTQNGGAGLPAISDDDIDLPLEGFSFAVSARVKRLLDRYKRLGGIA